MTAPLLLFLQVVERVGSDTAAADTLCEATTHAAAVPGAFEWVTGGAAAVSAIAAAIAAGISAHAARQTNAFNQRQTTWNRAEKQRTYYDAILVGPALDALRHYRRAMGKALREGAQSVHDAVDRDATISEHRAAVDAVLDSEFTGLRDKLRDVLLEAAKDWNDGDLLVQLQSKLQRLEDEVTEEVLKLLSPEAEVNFEAVVNDVSGDIVRLVMKFDPALRATQSNASNIAE